MVVRAQSSVLDLAVANLIARVRASLAESAAELERVPLPTLEALCVELVLELTGK
jgi:hypothetical protein